MIVKSSLLLLSVASAFASDQVPLGGSSVCLESTSPNDCCLGGATTGKAVIEGRTFEFTCGSKLQSLNSKSALEVDNAHACALECAKDMSCEASTFKAHGKQLRGGKNCFFVMGDNMDQKVDEEWIAFNEIFPSCLESEDLNACCSDPAKQEGEVLIDGVRWKWTCKSILAAMDRNAKVAQNAYECASLCASQGCEGTSFRVQGNRPDKCFFIKGDNRDQNPSQTFLSVVKILEEEVDPPVPEPECEEQLQETEAKLQDCLNNPPDSAKLVKCEADKLALETAETECRQDANQFEQKKDEWRLKHQQCETEKGELNLDKQKCDNEKAALDLQLTHKEDEITSLDSQVTSLKDKLAALQKAYDALDVECNGKGVNAQCRSNFYDAQPRDDGCIIDAGFEQFKIYYGKLDDPGYSDLGSASAGSFKECAERCANYKGAKKCVRFMWSTDGKDRACYMRSTGRGMVPTKSSKWSSGQIV